MRRMLSQKLFSQTFGLREACLALAGVVGLVGCNPQTLAPLQIERFFHISGQIGAVRDLIEILQGLLAIAPLLKASQELGKRLSCRALAISGQSSDKAAHQTNENQPSPHVLWLLDLDSCALLHFL